MFKAQGTSATHALSDFPTRAAHPRSHASVHLSKQEEPTLIPEGVGVQANFAHVPISLQPKLTVDPADSPLEREADRTAEQVMNAHQPGSPTLHVQRKPHFQQAADRPERTPHSPDFSSGGQPMQAPERDFFEDRFGKDFSHVRLHADSRSADIAQSLEARAFTLGQHIFFGEGEYTTTTYEGKTLLAHELVHTIQQGQNPVAPLIQRQQKPEEPATAFTPSQERILRQHGVDPSTLPSPAAATLADLLSVAEEAYESSRLGQSSQMLANRPGLSITLEEKRSSGGGTETMIMVISEEASVLLTQRTDSQADTLTTEFAYQDSQGNRIDAISSRVNLARLEERNVRIGPDIDLDLDESRQPETLAEQPASRLRSEKEAAESSPIEADETSLAEKIVVGSTDIVTDFVPVVSNFKDAYTALTGENPITGEKVGLFERVLAGITAIPALGNVVKYVFKGSKLLVRLGKLTAKAIRIVGSALQRLGAKVIRAGVTAAKWVKVEAAALARKGVDLAKRGYASAKAGVRSLWDRITRRSGSRPVDRPPDEPVAIEVPVQGVDEVPSNVYDIRTGRQLSEKEVSMLPPGPKPDLRPVSEAQKRVHRLTRQQFRDRVMKILMDDPDHPLSFLVREKGKWYPRRTKADREANIDKLWDAGRLAHQRSGVGEVVGVEATARNQAKGSRYESKGIGPVSRFVDVKGIPVEENTAKMWVRQGKLEQHHIGGYVDGWPLE